ncbi:hypothetical protein AB0F77_14415 [Streptomyces sp. NPDC026672]|uniref:hypothetical protein n=1 Tax=unclassified Streptomyces TaxID=2593676 RepID=UPI0033DC706B
MLSISESGWYAIAIAGAVLAMSLLRAEPAPVLFLYSVAFVSVPIAAFPLVYPAIRQGDARPADSGAQVKPGRLAKAWAVGVASVAVVVATGVVMASPYGRV